MKQFLSKNFLLESSTAEKLYHDCASSLPIIDYHSHLSPRDIAEDRQFNNITEIWLDGDHYKWRAMRTLGINEEFITGNASDIDKFKKWAETVPHTLRNPLYHWTHLELRRYFGVDELLNPDTAESIFKHTEAQLNTEEFSTRNLLRHMNVELVCTSDDPISSLKYHQQIANDHFEIHVCPTFRPDKAYSFNDAKAYSNYIDQLEDATNTTIKSFEDLVGALEDRIDYFDKNGCFLSDHGLEQTPYRPASTSQIASWFSTIRNGEFITPDQAESLRYHILLSLSKMYDERNWVQQFHLGAIRNTNSRMQRKLGADSGFDSIGDFKQTENLAGFLNDLDKTDQLTRTILYNVNPTDNAAIATMTGNFNDGSTKGKMQFGPAWWFLDQEDGIKDQLDMLSNMGLISCFIGMLTDSRSFLSYSRHEYFRRILCNQFGNDLESGKLPHDMDLIQEMVADICYNNAKEYFNLEIEEVI